MKVTQVFTFGKEVSAGEPIFMVVDIELFNSIVKSGLIEVNCAYSDHDLKTLWLERTGSVESETK